MTPDLVAVEREFAVALANAGEEAVHALRAVFTAHPAWDPRHRVNSACTAAFHTLYPAMVRLGRTFIPKAMRMGWHEGNARTHASAARLRRRRRALGGWYDVRAEPPAPVLLEFSQSWPGVADYILGRPNAYAPAAAQTTIDLFRAQLMVGIEDGLGIDAIARDIVASALPDIARWRALLIARTEVLSAGNRSAMASYEASGVVKKKRWLSTQDKRTRETHRTELWATPVVVELDKPFVLPSKARLMFPGDTSLGAPLSEICNCRCSVAPEVSLPGVPDYVPTGPPGLVAEG